MNGYKDRVFFFPFTCANERDLIEIFEGKMRKNFAIEIILLRMMQKFQSYNIDENKNLPK